MVSTAVLGDATTQLVQGLRPEDEARVRAALSYAIDAYGERSSFRSALRVRLLTCAAMPRAASRACCSSSR
jgi:GTP pyrophosphokinase